MGVSGPSLLLESTNSMILFCNNPPYHQPQTPTLHPREPDAYYYGNPRYLTTFWFTLASLIPVIHANRSCLDGTHKWIICVSTLCRGPLGWKKECKHSIIGEQCNTIKNKILLDSPQGRSRRGQVPCKTSCTDFQCSIQHPSTRLVCWCLCWPVISLP